MALTLITHPFMSPERIARTPIKCRGGWAFTHPPKNLWRYNRHARNQAIKEWALYGTSALASLIGGTFVGPVGMALVSGGNSFWPNCANWTTAPSTSNNTMNSAGQYYALVFRAPKTGNIRQIGCSVQAATGSPTADFQLETVSATTGLPTGTLFGTNTRKTGVALTAIWKLSGAFTADAAVTKGDLMAAVVRYASGTSFVLRSEASSRWAFPYYVLNGTKTPTEQAILAVYYDDGSCAYTPGTVPMSGAVTTTAFSSSTNPNHRGNVWTTPIPARAVGGWMQTSNAQNFDLIIASDAWDGTADNDGTSNITTSLDKDQLAGSGGPVYILGSVSLSFTAGLDYRSICKPGASNVSVYHIDVDTAGVLDQMELGQAYRITTANNPTQASSWSDVATQRMYCGFWLDQFDDGASAGSMMRPVSLSGGLV